MDSSISLLVSLAMWNKGVQYKIPIYAEFCGDAAQNTAENTPRMGHFQHPNNDSCESSTNYFVFSFLLHYLYRSGACFRHQ